MRELHKSEMKIIRCGAPEDIAQILNYTIPDVQLKSTVFQLQKGIELLGPLVSVYPIPM